MGDEKMSLNEPGVAIRLVLALVVDVAFGVLFNRWVAQHQTRNGGVYTAFYVVAGVGLTLASAVLVIGLSDVLLMAVLFAASGLPMVIGSMQRHTDRIHATTQDAQAMALEMLHGAASEE
jgi:hypothetical protein